MARVARVLKLEDRHGLGPCGLCPWEFESPLWHLNMQSLTSETQKLAEILAEPEKKHIQPGEEAITVSKTVSAAAVIYEAARNAVEFRAEHLIRRAAIERILKRRVLTNPSGEGIAEALVRELLWARYLENGSVPIRKIEEIQETIKKYLVLRKEKITLSDWLLGIASCEIEKKLVPAPYREALINFVYQVLQRRISLPLEKDKKTHDIQVYIATHRGFALSDEPIIRFHLFSSFFPEWIDLKPQAALKILPKFTQVYQEIEKQLDYPLKDQLRRYVSRLVAPFNVIRDLAEVSPSEFAKTVSDPDVLEERCRKILTRRYQETGARLRRAAFRSIIYIFLTKMLFALLLEFPFDLLLGKPNFWALATNSLFPPALMFLVTASIRLPGEENTKKVISEIKEFVYQEQPVKTTIELVPPARGKILGSSFMAIYFLTYLLIFGGIIFLLNKAHFNILSQAIFLFFLSVVSFFGYRVRLLTKTYELTEKEWVLTPIVDFLFLPILRVGQWLSNELAQINILIFIFDFVIEAPFKAFFSVVEEWIHFVQAKREEITT